MEVSEECITALNKAKVGLMRSGSSVFFMTLVFNMKFRWENSEQCKTLATDGIHIVINPDFWMKMNHENRIFLLVHEAMHVAYQHVLPSRIQLRDFETWNDAADHVINLQLVARGFQMPQGGLCDKRFEGMSTEQVYNILMDEKKGGGKGKGSGSNGTGSGNQYRDIIKAPSGTPEHDLQAKIQKMLVQAQLQSQLAKEAPGSVPGDFELLIDSLLNPKLPWQVILRKYLSAFAKTDYSFKKPNRRFFPDHYLPTLHGESLMDLTIGVDISGSVSDEDFTFFVSEIASIFRMMKPKRITVVQFDTKIQHVNTVSSINELLSIKFTGRGGTDVTPMLNYSEKHKAQLTLIFTDGEFSAPNTTAKPNTLWMIHNNDSWEAPGFGKTIHYEMNHAN